MEGYSCIGWVTNKFKPSNKDGYIVSGCPHSWSFDTQEGRKGHINKWTYWDEMTTDGCKQVLGVALNMVNRIMSYGWNGSWTSPRV